MSAKSLAIREKELLLVAAQIDLDQATDALARLQAAPEACSDLERADAHFDLRRKQVAVQLASLALEAAKPGPLAEDTPLSVDPDDYPLFGEAKA